MNGKRSRTSDSFSNTGIPLAGEPDDGPGGPGADGTEGSGTRLERLDLDGTVGDVADDLRPISHAAYATAGGVGLSLLVENTGTRAFECIEAEVRLDGGGSR